MQILYQYVMSKKRILWQIKNQKILLLTTSIFGKLHVHWFLMRNYHDTNIVFQQYYQNIIYWKQWEHTCNTGNKKGALLWAIKKNSMHPSIKNISNSIKNSKEFPFESKDKEFIEKVMKHLHPKNPVRQNDIPVKTLKINADFFFLL